MNTLTIKFKRGTKQEHEHLPFFPIGMITMCTDFPELRFHDGMTPGGVPIQLPEQVHKHLLDYGFIIKIVVRSLNLI